MAYPYYNPYQYPTQYQPMQPQTASVGFVRVQSEDEARRYPVTVGSVTFIDDNSPHCYVKTAPASPMDAPIFKRFKLVEEPETPMQPQSAKNGDFSDISQKGIDLSAYAKNDDMREIRAVIDEMRADMDKLRFDIDAVTEKSSKKMVQRARKDADEE